jgi:hypothetical protein
LYSLPCFVSLFLFPFLVRLLKSTTSVVSASFLMLSTNLLILKTCQDSHRSLSVSLSVHSFFLPPSSRLKLPFIVSSPF